MHHHMAESWLCAGGLNNREDMQAFLAEMSNQDFVDEEIEAWDLNEYPDFDRDELIDAFQYIRENFDEVYPEED